jgi:hypothetical protein
MLPLSPRARRRMPPAAFVPECCRAAARLRVLGRHHPADLEDESHDLEQALLGEAAGASAAAPHGASPPAPSPSPSPRPTTSPPPVLLSPQTPRSGACEVLHATHDSYALARREKVSSLSRRSSFAAMHSRPLTPVAPRRPW